MGRREKPIDPATGPVARFAVELRKLREEAGGIAYRALAERTGYSITALSRAAAGERLPSLALTLSYAKACGGDEQDWERRWRAAAREESEAAAASESTAAAPYRGLARFDTGDAHLFFGRDHLTDLLMQLAKRHRVTVVFGPSGSGKSSLLRAGVIPRLLHPDAGGPCPVAVRILTPGAHPLHAHTDILAPAPADGDTWLVVDQFEEVFTLAHDSSERGEFIARLLAARHPENRLRVLLGVRADFYARCLEHPELAAVIRESSLPVPPMSSSELHEVIVKPAAGVGLLVERALTAHLIEEVGQEPGALPLLSHVLLETWRRRRGHTLTMEAYEAAGGLHGAIAQTAETVYTQLPAPQAATARGILLRLITPGDGTPDTSRPVDRNEIDPSPATELVLERLARGRLLTLNGRCIELTHETLIAAWPRLRAWIEEERESLRQQRRLTEAARTWDELARDSGALYRGGRLATWRETVRREGSHGDLSLMEREFLDASIAGEEAERAAASRRNRQLRVLALCLAVLLAVAASVGVIAFQQREDAVHQRQVALHQRQLTISRQLASQALGLAQHRPSLAKLLSLAAFRTAPTAEARGALLSMSTYQYHQGELTGHGDAVSEVAFSPSGTLASVSRDRTVALWDTRRHARLATLRGHRTWLRAVAFSSDGRMMATGGDDKKVMLWDAGRGTRRAVLTGHIGSVRAVAFSPDGRHLVSAGLDRSVIVWDPARGVRRATLTGHGTNVYSLAFSPGPKPLLASSGENGTVTLWDVGRVALTGHRDRVNKAVFSPDGRTLATASDDGSAALWDLRDGTRSATFNRHTGAANSVAFSPDGRGLAVATGADTHPPTPGVLHLWQVAKPPRHAAAFTARADRFLDVAYSPDARTVATAGADGTVVLWDAVRRTRLASLSHNAPPTAGGVSKAPARTASGAVFAVAFRPDSRTLATADADASVHLWRVFDRHLLAVLSGHSRQVRTLAFSPDGRTLASGGVDGTVLLWNTNAARTADQLCRTVARDLTREEWSNFAPDTAYRRICSLPRPAPRPHQSPSSAGTDRTMVR
ncbi:hypothetical protein [Streptomyces sp. NPDC058308]|uniref:nSTAND1 domain-containing NTPase n=1 Tax=Streptomyces sp. NPDC058308 TaxID=3346440 RepID=UPI0036EA988F